MTAILIIGALATLAAIEGIVILSDKIPWKRGKKK